MATHLLQPDRIVLDEALAVGALVEVVDGQIRDVRFANDPAARRLPGTLLPGLVDLQVNGTGGRGVDEANADSLDQIAISVGEQGASAFLPTLISAPWPRLLEQVRAVAAWTKAYQGRGAIPLGIHIEGPFLVNAGAHDPDCLIDPSPQRLEALLAAGDGEIALLTLAPSRAGAADAVRTLRQAGVQVALGHGTGTAGIAECIAAGAGMATHLFNAMGPSDHRDPGMAATLMDSHQVSCSLIPDGHHLHPVLVRQALKLLGVARCILVTDSIAATGMPDGDYRLGHLPVTLRDGVVRNGDGTLAGAALTMFEAAQRFLAMVPDASAWCLGQVASHNPARCINAKEWGTIEPGRRARFALLGDDGSLAQLHFDAESDVS